MRYLNKNFQVNFMPTFLYLFYSSQSKKKNFIPDFFLEYTETTTPNTGLSGFKRKFHVNKLKKLFFILKTVIWLAYYIVTVRDCDKILIKKNIFREFKFKMTK